MKTKITIFITILISLGVNTFAQEPFDVNGYLIFEKNGEYYNIVGNDTLKIIPDLITLKYKEDATEQQINTFENTLKINKLYHAPTGWVNYGLDATSDVVDIVESIATMEFVYKVLFNRFINFHSIPNENAWHDFIWDLQFQENLCIDLEPNPPVTPLVHDAIPKNISHRLMEIDMAWEITTGSPDIVIGFIDSGTNVDHEDLGFGNDNYHNLWEHPVTGDFGWNFVNSNGNVFADNMHGTMVASVACAKTNNQVGTYGVAGGWASEGAKAMTLQISFGYGIEGMIHQALIYAAQNGARIINMSFGTPVNEAIEDAIVYVYEEHNCVLLAAVGNVNDMYISYPASHDYVIAVGATELNCIDDPSQLYSIVERRFGNNYGNTHLGSGYGEKLDIVALPYYYRCGHDNIDTYVQDYGMTSGATAYASGVAALVLSANPMLSNVEVAEILKNTADKIDIENGNYQNGHSLFYGYGRINAYQAVLQALDTEGEPYIEITGTVTWDLPRRQAGDVVVMPGAELTLTSTLYMQPDTRIIVRRGGKLVIDGGSVTSVGTGLRWRGIEVWGNSSQPQQVTHQGWVRIINEGSVKNSVMGIYTNRPDHAEEGRWEPGYTGGIVQGIDARFVNNKTALQFYPYNYPSVSGFTNCEFITYGYEVGVPESAFLVDITGINGISFLACNFENKCDAVEFYRSGIRCVNSFVKVHGKCKNTSEPCDDWDHSTFTGLHYGIHASSITSTYYVDVRNTEFNKNRRSLYLSGISNARITSNEFIINTPFKEDSGYGLYLDECTGYWVEDNEFRHDVSSRKGIGVIVNNSGTDPNEIYRNRFHNLEQGISAQGNNKDPKSATGLQILCNDFVDCDADILVVNPSESRGIGIAAHQGADSQNPQHMAGNLFHRHTAVDFNDINNEGEDIIYYVPLNYNQQYHRVIPEEYTVNTVTVTEVELLDDWTYNGGCPCKLESGGGGHEEEMKQQMAESQQEANALQETLELLIDAGDTESLFWDVHMSTSPEAMQVYQELMNTSPYLSDTVVSAAIIKEDVLVDAMLRDIMVANPHSAKSGKLLEELDQRWTPLPEYMKAQIMQGKNLVSVRESMESTLARHQLDKAIAVNTLARNWHNNTDSLVGLWSFNNNLTSKYKLAFLYLELGQAAQGTAVLNHIPTQFNLSSAQQTGHQQISAVYDLLASLAHDGKSILEADSLQIAALLEIETESNGLAGIYARNALLALQAFEYDEPIILPDLMKSRAMAEAYSKLLETMPPKNLGIFPVPARDYLVIEYVLDTESKGEVEFTDASGRIEHTLTASGPINQKIVDIRQWKPGWYIATLKTQTKTLESVKFIISD
jgi:subtilisin family serine protease